LSVKSPQEGLTEPSTDHVGCFVIRETQFYGNYFALLTWIVKFFDRPAGGR